MKRHNCEFCGVKLTCGNKENMQKVIDSHNEVCEQKDKLKNLRG